MREAAAILQFERRLVELGFPSERLRQSVAELADHFEDLKAAAKGEGLSEAEAATHAAQQLGEPVALAEHVAAVLRQSSWWGRHPFIGFCLLPPLAIFATLLPGVLLEFSLFRRYFTSDAWAITAGGGPGFSFIVNAANGSAYLAMALVALTFCWLARRSAAGPKWALAACGICSLHGYFSQLAVHPHSVKFGYRLAPEWSPDDWIVCGIPLTVGLYVWLRQRFTETRLAPVESESPSMPVHQFRPGKTPLITPTRLTAVLALAGLAALLAIVKTALADEEARGLDLASRVWPAERAAVVQQLRAGQQSTVSSTATTINLGQWLNAGLDDSVDGPATVLGNSLTGIPRGTHVFAGVPFDVEGRLQLAGRMLLESRTQFPAKVKNIAIMRRAARIHLLHGTSSTDEKLSGTAIAKLVLHYADGSLAEIPIVAGRHVLDWCGPIHETDVPEKLRKPSAPDSALAWVGMNEFVKEHRPNASLRLFRTTFDNPEPGREIASLDYVSAVTDAAPFLVGLTVE